MNILLTSVGRRSYLVKYFKDALGDSGQVHVGNSSRLTPAFLCADRTAVTPLIYDENYIPFLLEYCQGHKISALLSLFDLDLPVLAANRRRFAEVGVRLVLSDERVVVMCNDKWESYRFCLGVGLQCPESFVSEVDAHDAVVSGVLEFPLIIKPRWGCGSLAISEAENTEELAMLYRKTKVAIMRSFLKYETEKHATDGVLIQRKLCGQEYGLDVINDLEGNFLNTIVKKKFAMRSGETDSAEVVTCEPLWEIGKILGTALRHVGNLDVDVIVDGGVAYVLEMNARFGGHYPFSHLAGVDLPLAIVQWLRGEEVDRNLLSAKPGVAGIKDIEIRRICLAEPSGSRDEAFGG